MPNISDFCGYCGKLLGGHCCEKMTPTKAVIDPWVKVGTTTIDGDRPQVASALGLEVPGLDAVLGYIITDRRVLHVGGHNIIPVQWECNDYGGMVHCDIVRRQSEIDAERRTAPCINCEVQTATLSVFCDECMDRFRDYEPPCPECGPHGNRGEVLLASSWAKCTTCAGGKPGDLWGEVKVHEPATAQGALSSALIAKGASSEVAQAGVRAFIKAIQMDAKVSTPRGVGHVRYQATGGSFRVSLPGQGHVWFEPDEVFEVP